jgi:hypothetical protein
MYLLQPLTGTVTNDSACGVSKGCYHDCDSSGACTFLITWVSTSGSTVDFTIQMRMPGSTNYWVALGLSNDKTMVSKMHVFLPHIQCYITQYYTWMFCDVVLIIQELVVVVQCKSQGHLCCTFSSYMCRTRIYNWYIGILNGIVTRMRDHYLLFS